MKHICHFTALAVCLVLLSCGQGKKDTGIFPSPHPVTVKAPPQGIPDRDRYTKFDRDAVLKKVAEDERYSGLIENARKSVAQLVAMSDDQLRGLIPPANTKRALMVNRNGCPVHGGGVAVYQPFGTSADLSYPLHVKCPIGGEVYPNKDFPDDGQGWVDNRPDSPTKGEKYYFVGWFNHWFLTSLPGRIKTLGQLWFLTGDEKYSHTAQVLLKRFMEVYPDIDSNDLTYDGSDWGIYIKTTCTPWEGPGLMNMTMGFELLLPTVDDQFIRDYREKVIRPAFEAHRAKPAPSNWGNSWNPAFVKFVNVTGDTEILDYLLYEHPVAVVPTLDNQLFRDGFPYEAAFSYGSDYLYEARNIANGLGPDNSGWIWEHPHLKEAFKGYAELMCLDRFTHFFGDTGGLTNKGLTLAPYLLEDAWNVYRTPVAARYLLQAYEVNGTARSVTLDDLFTGKIAVDMDDVNRAAAQAKPLESTLAPVRGFAIMRTGAGDDRTELFLDFGYAHAAHSHADRLNINIFALGREFIPEMGYPEYMDSVAPTPGGWTTHTVSHATVEVDEKRQLEGVFGDLHGFVSGDGIRYVDASCEDAYVHCGVDLFRRTLALIDVPGGAYVVDLFRVRGGKTHDYLFHGLPVDVALRDVELSKPRKGTLAGEDVEFGWKPDSVLPYHVDNKGYQYLYDVCECRKDSPYSANWTDKDGVTFSAAFLPDGEEMFYLTKGYPRPSSKTLPPMPFLVRRKIPAGSDDISQFVSVLSIDRDAKKPLVVEARRLEMTPDSDPGACGVIIRHAFGEDVVISTLSPDGRAKTADGRFELRGQFGAASWRGGALERMTLIGGTDFTADGKTVHQESAGIQAVVRQVYDDRIVLDRPLPPETTGQVIYADRAPVETSYRVESIEGSTVRVSPGTWIGRGRVASYDEAAATVYDSRDVFPLGEKRNRLADITGMKYPEGNRNYYAGSWMAKEDGSSYYRLTSGGFPGFVLDRSQNLSKIEKNFPKGATFVLYDLGPGDTVRTLAWKQEVFR
ncbi:heparinase II/III-family protein [bacterium]|nr:heparinase II/III-family protein [bacterium]